MSWEARSASGDDRGFPGRLATNTSWGKRDRDYHCRKRPIGRGDRVSHQQGGGSEGPQKSLERMNRFQAPEARRIIAELGLPQGSRGLDVGCGVGLYALWLAEAVAGAGRVDVIEPENGVVVAAVALACCHLEPGMLEFRPGHGTSIP